MALSRLQCALLGSIVTWALCCTASASDVSSEAQTNTTWKEMINDLEATKQDLENKIKSSNKTKDAFEIAMEASKNTTKSLESAEEEKEEEDEMAIDSKIEMLTSDSKETASESKEEDSGSKVDDEKDPDVAADEPKDKEDESSPVPGMQGMQGYRYSGYNNRYFDIQPLKDTLRNCRDCYTYVGDSRLCPMHEPALELKKWTQELADVLGEGCMKPGNCDSGGTCCLSKIDPFDSTIVRMTQMIKDIFHAVRGNCDKCQAPLVNPLVALCSEWGRWSPCSNTCGAGTEKRTRTCKRRGDLNWGGDETETRACSTGERCCPPPVWSHWGQWSSCVQNCGHEQVTRSRSCPVHVEDRYKGCPQCLGRATESKSIFCGSSKEVGVWQAWQPWEACNAQCGQTGTKRRTRYCSVSDYDVSRSSCAIPCQGKSEMTLHCYGEPCCESATWSSWGPWSSCSEPCGHEQVTRTRTCPTNFYSLNALNCPRTTCHGSATESKRVVCGQVKEVGFWQSWEAWGPCSVSCGQGQRQRDRPCSVDTYRRHHNNWNRCVIPCKGKSREVDVCFEQTCDTCGNVMWSSWSSWSSCSKSCGHEQVTRTRSCPRRFNCPRCPGRDSQVKSQYCGPTEVIGQWEHWGAWSRCDKTCGGGKRSRTRMCSNKDRNFHSSECVKPCQGIGGVPTNVEDVMEACNTHSCPYGHSNSIGTVHGVMWTAWEAWCPCDCNTGRRNRKRQCVYEIGTTNWRALDYSPEKDHLCQDKYGGSSREEEFCDISASSCPACRSRCKDQQERDLRDGDYPSCSSCSHYITCRNGRGISYNCENGAEWDAFVRKCVLPLPPGSGSPSCSLQLPITDCYGKVDGIYHSKRSCSHYITCRNGRISEEKYCRRGEEFNAHRGECHRGQSRTCVRPDEVSDFYFNDRPEVGELGAPESMYYDETHGLNATQRREAYEKEMKEKRDDDVTEAKNEERVRLGLDSPTPDNKTTAPEMKFLRRVNPDCVMDCTDKPMGHYGSCRICSAYVICTKHGHLRERRCHGGKEFDTTKRKCVAKARTCVLKGIPVDDV